MAYAAQHRTHWSAPCGCSARPGPSKGHLRTRAATGAEPSTRVKPFEIPSGAEAATRQSIEAIKAAYKAGVQRHRIDALLPLIGATDLDDWCALRLSLAPDTSRAGGTSDHCRSSRADSACKIACATLPELARLSEISRAERLPSTRSARPLVLHLSIFFHLAVTRDGVPVRSISPRPAQVVCKPSTPRDARSHRCLQRAGPAAYVSSSKPRCR